MRCLKGTLLASTLVLRVVKPLGLAVVLGERVIPDTRERPGVAWGLGFKGLGFRVYGLDSAVRTILEQRCEQLRYFQHKPGEPRSGVHPEPRSLSLYSHTGSCKPCNGAASSRYGQLSKLRSFFKVLFYKGAVLFCGP